MVLDSFSNGLAMLVPAGVAGTCNHMPDCAIAVNMKEMHVSIDEPRPAKRRQHYVKQQ